MVYDYVNRRFMSVYRPVRQMQRVFPGLLSEVAPGVAYAAGSYGIAAARRKYLEWRNSLYGQAAAGAVQSLKRKRDSSEEKNNNMPSVPANRRRSMPPTPQQRGRSMTRNTSARGRSRSMSGINMLLDTPSFAASRSRSRMRKRIAKLGRPKVTIQASIGKKYKKAKAVKITKMDGGVSLAKEFGSTIEGNQSLYVGHCSAPAVPVYRALVSALIKKYALLCDFEVDDFDLPLRYHDAGDLFKIRYKIGQDGVIQDFDYPTPANWTLKNVIDYFTTMLTVSLAGSSQLELQTLEYWDVEDKNTKPPKVCMDLRQVRIKLETVSSLKFQNRSVSEGGNASTDLINTNPLIGRLYAGSGTGTSTVSHAALPGGAVGFYADGFNGHIAVDGTAQHLKEPPLPKDFTRVKYSKKVSIAPGEVQTHVLKGIHNMYLNTYIRKLNGTGLSSLTGENFNLLGKYCFFGFERMLWDGSAEFPISLAYEIDHKCRARAYTTVTPKTTTINYSISG